MTINTDDPLIAEIEKIIDTLRESLREDGYHVRVSYALQIAERLPARQQAEKEKMIAELEKRFEGHRVEMEKHGDICDFDCYRLVLGQYKEQKQERVRE